MTDQFLPDSPPRILIAGGGTGGHILAGIAIAEQWSDRWGSPSSILFVGTRGKIEERLVPQAGYSLEVLEIGSLNRVSIQQKIKTCLQLPLAFLRSLQILLRFRPQFVLGVGGYSSGPILLLSRALRSIGLLRSKTAILEQNSIPGFTNRILGKYVDTIFTAFPGAGGQFPNKNVLLTGNPIRAVIKRTPSAPRDPFTLFIFGGSQGAIGINTLVLSSLSYLTDLGDRLTIIHQTGERDYDRVREGYGSARLQASIHKFVDDMPKAYGQASLLICRSGSSTLAEIAAVGRAALLIPLPTAADNHQEKNAREFVDAGAAELLLQQGATGENLAKIIRGFFLNPTRLSQMEEAVTQFHRPHAAREIVQSLIQS